MSADTFIEPRPVEAGPHEAKFVLPADRVPAVLDFLTSRLSLDPEHPEAIVTSLYYDTPGLRLLADKEDSDYLKSKVRVRWYRDPVTGEVSPDAFMEMKAKEGARRSKARVPMPGEGPEIAGMSLLDPRLNELPRRLVEAGVDVPPGLAPLITIAYRRRRFVLPRVNARVCIDWDIRTTHVHPRVGAAPNTPLPEAVVEVKGSERMLTIELANLTLLGVRLSSFSKYLNCVRSVHRRF